MWWNILLLLMGLLFIEICYVTFARKINQVLTLKSLIMRSWLTSLLISVNSFPSFYKISLICKIFWFIYSFLRIFFILRLHSKNLKSRSKKIFSIFWIIHLLSHFLLWLFHHLCWLIIIAFLFIWWTLEHIHTICSLSTTSYWRKLTL